VNLDSLFKRHFRLAIGILIAIAAYCQASGLSSLVAEAWLRGAPADIAGRPRLHPTTPTEDARITSADPILARNPFDSITGPLVTTPEPGRAARRSSDPYGDSVCEGTRVLLIVDSDDPAWSFATIAVAGHDPLLRRLGDDAFGRSVHAIAWDRVWLVERGERCQLRLGDNVAPSPPASYAPAAAPEAAPPQGKKRSKRALPPEIAAKIRQIGEREFVLDRATVEEILAKQSDLTRGVRVAPVSDGERVTGVRLARVAPDSLLGSLGMKNGDELRSINGFEMTDPQKALEAYARLRTSDNISVALQRGGKDTTIDIHIK
jgi:general secretion pathway protein C